MSSQTRLFFDSTTDDIISVSDLEAIGPLAWQKLRQAFSHFSKILAAGENKLVEAGLTTHQAGLIKKRPADVQVAKRLMASKNIGLLTIDDKNYPALLREINDPPLWLFYRGHLETLTIPSLTVVGTRRPTAYGKVVIEELIDRVVAENVCLVSGLAYGVDKAVHQRSLECGGKTIAVLAGGLDTIYPVDHYRLAQEIIDSGGLILSEYPPLSRPKPYRFPIRNRIIAGLSRATIVIQAGIKSGTLTTAKSALDYNREVFAVPGDINRDVSQGPNFLITHGAQPLVSAFQLLDYFGLKSTKAKPSLDKDSANLLNLLSTDPLSVDQLVEVSHLSIEVILGLLTRLELEGLIYQPKTSQYARK
jgi:DNA processing protein